MKEEKLDEIDKAIVDSIRGLPYIEPPPHLAADIMKAIDERESFWWRRFIRWLKTPRTFTVTPVRLLPIAAFVTLILTVGTYKLITIEPENTNVGVALDRVVNNKLIPVVFVFDNANAKSVAVVGSFNGWQPEGYEMTWDKTQRKWILRTRLPLGRYEYAFLVNGKTIVPDPNALLYQDDGFGRKNAVLLLGINDDASRV